MATFNEIRQSKAMARDKRTVHEQAQQVRPRYPKRQESGRIAKNTTRKPPQSDLRSTHYRVLLYIVLNEESILYHELVDRVAEWVEPEHAVAALQMKRRKNIATTSESIRAGQRHVARQTIDRAKRYGRVLFVQAEGQDRYVCLGRPAQLARHGRYETTWDDEWEALEDIHRLLHPIIPFAHREAGDASTWRSPLPDDVSRFVDERRDPRRGVCEGE